MANENEENLLRSVALQNAQSILSARQRAEQELIRAKEALELRTAELARSLAMMRATLESTTDGILVTDGGGEVTGFNEKFVAMWRVPREVMDSKDHPRLLDMTSRQIEDPRHFLARIDDIYATSPQESYDLLELADGRVFERFSRIQFVEGRNVGRVWSFRDVTERRRQETIIEEQRRLAEFGRDIGLAFTEGDSLGEMLDHCCALTIRHLDGALARIWTLDQAGTTLELRSSAGLYTHLDGPHARIPVGQLKIGLIALERKSHQTNSVIGDPRIPDQEWVQRVGMVAFAGYPLVVEDRLVGVWALFARHTLSKATLQAMESFSKKIGLGIERKRAEEALREAKSEAEQANHAKTQFLAVLSHELRTPLNPILLAVTAMLERPEEPEQLRTTLEMIRQNVNLQARLIDDLLDVMRIVRGKMPMHWEVADGHRLIGLAIQVCQSEILGKGLKIEADLAADAHHVNADPARLQQVFWNLIKNAVKFTPSGGTITIRTRNEDSGRGREGRLVVELSDTGIGIEPEVLPTIFDPFQQGETTITRTYGGLGLGLAICRGIIEAHGGTLAAESAGKGQGATFRIVLQALPIAAVKEQVEPDASSRAPKALALAALRILVVEDEPATRRLMARLLSGLGHAVTTAGTIAAALEVLEAGELDLIVSDIGLPDGTGLDLMQRVVARRGPVPAIALTGYGMEEDVRRSRESGFSAHLIKPIDFAKLEAMIQRVVH